MVQKNCRKKEIKKQKNVIFDRHPPTQNYLFLVSFIKPFSKDFFRIEAAS